MKAYAFLTASTGYREYPAASRPKLFWTKGEAIQCLKKEVSREDEQFVRLNVNLLSYLEKEESGFEWTVDCSEPNPDGNGINSSGEEFGTNIDELITYHIFEVELP